jgi:hypothetical protein
MALGVCPAAAEECGGAGEVAVVRAAQTLVPDGDRLTVRAVDPELTGDPGNVRKLDAFIVRERDGSIRPIVYLNCRSELFQEARRGSRFHVKILAAVIAHEACHLEGGDEAQARQAERNFVTGLIRRGLLAEVEGALFLRQLERSIR